MPNYPGLGLPLRYTPDDYSHYPIGAHGSCRGAVSDLIPIRELAMMSIMDSLTEKEDWHRKVFDDEIVSKWREEALAIPDEQFVNLATSDKYQRWDSDGNLEIRNDRDPNRQRPLKGIMTTTTFNCLIEELRSKARYFEKSGLIPTLDASASVAKSDKAVPPELHEALCRAFDRLKRDQLSADWHPNTNDLVRNLVHPSMYPLVYGRSRGFTEEVVGVDDAIAKWAGKGDIILNDGWRPSLQGRHHYPVGNPMVPPEYWSDTYQWLPANVAFQEDGTVKFTSYVSNLHPNRYPDIYRVIEQLIERSLPSWDQCLALSTGYHAKTGAGRIKPRFQYPEDPDDEINENWDPSDPQEVADVEVNWDEVERRHRYDPRYEDETTAKWKLLRKPVIPEPSFEDVDYAPASGETLAERFAKSGLQVIVKMASIELTPDKPQFPAGGWHIEGQMNEHICATALYYLDSENITASSLSFRMQTSAYLDDEIHVGQGSFRWLEKIYGTSLGAGNSPCLQNYGSVETRQGRLLAFPNAFQHRVSPFRLEDPTKPGHRRFVALWLVDPTQRIISTANIPPQRMDWWLDSVFGNSKDTHEAASSALPAELVALMEDKGLDKNMPGAQLAKLPMELMDMVREYFNTDGDPLPMHAEEAKEHRVKLMKARGAFDKTAEAGWQQHSYSFCEH